MVLHWRASPAGSAKKGTRIGHMTERKKVPKLCEVLQRFFPKLNESIKLLRCERSGTRFGSERGYVFDFS